MNLQFKIDQGKCIDCGECTKDCPLQLIEMVHDTPTMSRENEQRCLRCQHCFAVCPTGALSIMGLDPAASPPLSGNPVEPLRLAALMKGRRSVRRYKKEAVSPQDLKFLLESAGYAPTAVNNRQLLFSVIDSPQVMDRLRERSYEALKKLHNANAFPAGLEFLQAYVTEALAQNRDIIFRDAPHMLIVSAPVTSLAPELDCHIALTYFELLAAGMGLGTLWCGLAKTVLTLIIPEILAELGIPEDHRIGYVMMFGKPDVTYHRTVLRNDTAINRIRQLA